MAKKYATYYFDEEVIKKAKVLAAMHNTSLSNYIEEILIREINKNKQMQVLEKSKKC